MLNEKEKIIIKKLRTNSRTQLTKIGRELKMPITTVFKITKNLENNIIKKYTSLIDFEKLNYYFRIFLISNSKKKKEFESFLIKHPRVNNIYKVSGNYDLISEIILKNRKEMEYFLEEIKKFKIKEKSILYIIEEYKKESFINF
jgi:Lrp/AsnC family leucine-responsive transcriptional regulator